MSCPTSTRPKFMLSLCIQAEVDSLLTFVIVSETNPTYTHHGGWFQPSVAVAGAVQRRWCQCAYDMPHSECRKVRYLPLFWY